MVISREREPVVLAMMSRARAELTVIRCLDSIQAMHSTLTTACTFERHSSSSSAFVNKGRRQARWCCCRVPNKTIPLTTATTWQFYSSPSTDDDVTGSCYSRSVSGGCCWFVRTILKVQLGQSHWSMELDSADRAGVTRQWWSMVGVVDGKGCRSSGGQTASPVVASTTTSFATVGPTGSLVFCVDGTCSRDGPSCAWREVAWPHR